MRRLSPLAALLIPAGLAVASLGPVVLVKPINELAAYTPRGYASHSSDYWNPPAAYDDRIGMTRLDHEMVTVAASSASAIVGAAFAGDGWTFTLDYLQAAEVAGGDAVLSFSDSRVDEPYFAPIHGLRLMPRRDATGTSTRAPVMAVGTQPPYAVVPFGFGRHRIVISSSWDNATVRLDGGLAWSGNPGWSDLAGAYPILHLSPGELGVSAAPSIEVSFPAGRRAAPAAFRAAFVETALGAQDGSGLFHDTNRTDAWTALALVLEHRRTGDAGIADALDRWAEGRAGAAVAGRSWPGAPGAQSIRENVGEPGIPLALWANDRGREDWARAVATMVESAGFTGCVDSGLDWCRLGNLQPDGRVIRAGEPGATDLLASFQFAETAGFIAGADMPSRRGWIRTLIERTYKRLPCQVVEMLGPNRHETDVQPWSPSARRAHPTVMFLLGLAYAERPSDPVWSEPAVRRLLTCGMTLLDTQVGGPMGWRTGDLELDVAIGSQDVAASRLLAPVAAVVLDRERFDVAWERLIDGATQRARPGPDETPESAQYRTAIAAVMLEVIEP